LAVEIQISLLIYVPLHCSLELYSVFCVVFIAEKVCIFRSGGLLGQVGLGWSVPPG